jgi:hypothetical protein
MDPESDGDDDECSVYEGECTGCESFTNLDDVGLCSTCAGKLERDLIRTRLGLPPLWRLACLPESASRFETCSSTNMARHWN